MKSESEKLVQKHRQLTQSDNMKVTSHVQRDEGEWVRNTIMIENVDVPFVYRRKQQYQSLKGARVNITYYPTVESVADMEFETMKVVRLKRS
jgi:hypothetical protein